MGLTTESGCVAGGGGGGRSLDRLPDLSVRPQPTGIVSNVTSHTPLTPSSK